MRRTPPATSTLIEVRTGSGRLVGRLDPQTLIIEVKRKGATTERVDLKPYLAAAGLARR